MGLLVPLRKKSLLFVLPPAIFLIVGAVILFFALRCYDVFSTFSPATLSELTVQDLEGTWVEDDISAVYAAYARQATYQAGELKKIEGTAYVIGFGEEHYMGLFLRGSDAERAQAMLDAGGMAGTLHVKGTVRPMDSQTIALYRAAAGGDAAVEAVMLPFYLDAGRVNGRAPGLLWGILALCAALIALGTAAIVWAVKWGGQKKLLTTAAQLGELPKMLEKLEAFYGETMPIGGVRLNERYILFQKGALSVLERPRDLAWVYRKPAHLPGEKRCFVTLRMLDGGKHTLLMPEYEAKKLMTALSELLPELEQGWSRGLARAYKEDRESFAARR